MRENQTSKNDVPTGTSPPTTEPQKPDIPHFLKSKKSKVIGLTLLVIFSLLLTSTIALNKVRQDKKPSTPTTLPRSYQECISSPGSKIQESYPATCVTQDGQRFTQPLSDEEKNSLQPPSTTTTTKPTSPSASKTIEPLFSLSSITLTLDFPDLSDSLAETLASIRRVATQARIHGQALPTMRFLMPSTM